MAAAGFDQWDLGGTQRTILGGIGLSYGTVAAKERCPKFHRLLRAVNQYSYADEYASTLIYCCRHFMYGTASGKDIVDNENSFPGADGEASPKSPSVTLFFGEYATYPELSRHLKGEDNTPGSWSSDYLDLLFLEVGRNLVTELLSVVGVLQNPELLPIDWRM